MQTGPRRQARIECFRALYRMQVVGESVEESAQPIHEAAGLPDEARGYAIHLLVLFDLNREEVDEAIADHLRHWAPERLAQTDRAVVRMAVTELFYCPDVPPRAVIDEAIEIARRYGTNESGRFVNGVLDGVAKARGVL